MYIYACECVWTKYVYINIELNSHNPTLEHTLVKKVLPHISSFLTIPLKVMFMIPQGAPKKMRGGEITP